MLVVPRALVVVLLHQQPEAFRQIGRYTRVTPAGAAHQPRLALTPLGVEALDNAGQAAPLVAWVVLARWQQAGVSAPVIRVDWPALVVRRHLRPGPRKRLVGALAQR